MRKELLARHKDSLKALHDIFNFDFENDITILKHSGNFTQNSLKKLVASTSININDAYTIGLVITNVKYNENYNYLVDFTGLFFDITIAHEKRMETNTNYKTHEWFYNKSRFEEVRKEKQIITYIVIQAENKLAKTRNNKIDVNADRMKLNYKTSSYYGYKCHFTDLTYNCEYDYFVKNPNAILDKSGYLVEDKQLELKTKAQKIASEKAKNKVDALSLDNRIEEIKKRFEDVKKLISNRLLEAVCYEDLNRTKKAIEKLTWLNIDISNLIDKYENKRFSGIESYNKLNNEINKRFEEIEAD